MKESIQEVYDATDLTSARMAKDCLMQEYEKSIQSNEIVGWSIFEITAVLILHFKYRKRLWTTNGVENLNQEVRRREGVIRLFPNQDSVKRLLGALFLMQLEDDSLEERKGVSLICWDSIYSTELFLWLPTMWHKAFASS